VSKLGWNKLFGRNGAAPPSKLERSASKAPDTKRTPMDVGRQSSALDQFFQTFEGQLGLRILDLGVSNQENIDYFDQLGHKIKFDNFVRSLDEVFHPADNDSGQQNEDMIELFQSKVLNFEDESLNGILAWDSLQYLSPSLLEGAVSQMHSILRKGGQVLTLFHTEDRSTEVPFYSFRIQERNRVRMVERSRRKPAQYFSTRSLERLFRQFDQVKFFLTQDSLREVIARK
jgi:SAM-dependent methyltransferase